MGIDLIRGGRIPNRGFKKTKSSNAYMKSLIKVPSFPNIALLLPLQENVIQI